MKKIIDDWQIFAIDDNQYDLDILKKRLSQEGFYNLECFSDINQFRESINFNVVVIIVDHDLGFGINGLEIMKEVVSRVPLCYPIILSGNDNGDVIRKYTNNDAFRYVIKKGDFMTEVITYIKEAHERIKKIAELI